MNNPVWIKYWGLIPMTRRGYLVTLTMAAVIAIVVVVYFALAGRLPPLRTLWEPDAVQVRPGFFGWVYKYLWWLVVVCVLAHLFDTWLVFRQFARKEREQTVSEPPVPAATSAAPTSEGIQERRE